jgi:hypothetical protein
MLPRAHGGFAPRGFRLVSAWLAFAAQFLGAFLAVAALSAFLRCVNFIKASFHLGVWGVDA